MGRKEEAEQEPVIATMEEHIAVRDCIDLLSDSREWNQATFNYLMRVIGTGGKYMVEYRYAKGAKDGRLFGNGLQMVQRDARAYLCRNLYSEVDFRNCAPRIAIHLASINHTGHEGIEQLAAYCDHSVHYLETYPGLKNLLYQAMFSDQCPHSDNLNLSGFLKAVHKLCRAICMNTSEFSKLIQREESKNLELLIGVLDKFGITTMARIFDGVIVANSSRLTEALRHWEGTHPGFPCAIKNAEVPTLNPIPVDHWDFDDQATFHNTVIPGLGRIFSSANDALYHLRIPLLKTYRIFSMRTSLVKNTGRGHSFVRDSSTHISIRGESGIVRMEPMIRIANKLPEIFSAPNISFLKPPVTDAFSLYPGFLCKPVGVGCELITNHIHEVWSGSDSAVSEYIFDWLAFIAQNHPKQTGTILLINGDEGTGKSCLFSFIQRRIFGRLCLTMTGCDKLTRNFNNHLVGKILVCLEELKGDNENSYKHDLNRLKYLVDSPTIDIEKKGIDVFTEDNSINIIAFSNYDAPLPMVTGINRRLVQVRSSRCRQKDSEYFKTLNDYLDNDPEAPGAFLHFLMNRKVDEHRLRFEKPLTEDKILGQWNCLHDVDKAVYLLLRQHPKGLELAAHEMLHWIKKVRPDTKLSPVSIGRRLSSSDFPKRTLDGYSKYTINRDKFNYNPDMARMCEEFASEELDHIAKGFDLMQLLSGSKANI